MTEDVAETTGSTSLTVRQAYLAMVDYLVHRWEATSHPEFLATLLGDVDPTQWTSSYLPPDAVATGDPATWGDWLHAVAKVMHSDAEQPQ